MEEAFDYSGAVADFLKRVQEEIPREPPPDGAEPA